MVTVGNESTNCDACGTECFSNELHSVKVAGFSNIISVCQSCLGKTTYESYKDAAEILSDIVKIAVREGNNPESRLEQIRELLVDQK